MTAPFYHALLSRGKYLLEVFERRTGLRFFWIFRDLFEIYWDFFPEVRTGFLKVIYLSLSLLQRVK